MDTSNSESEISKDPLFVCNAYAQALTKLEQDFDKTFGYNKQREMFVDFTRKYTTIPEVWKKWFELENDFNKKHIVDELKNQALSHFFSLDFVGFLRPDAKVDNDLCKILEWPYMDVIRFKCYHVNPEIVAEGLNLAEAALSFPHWKLSQVFKLYSKTSKNGLSASVIKNYKYSRYLYRIISKSHNDTKKWFTFLRMTRNFFCITQNLEVCICKDPWNMQLWKFYIEYLKDINNIKVLNVYSRFCRLFISHSNIREDYRMEIERMHALNQYVAIWWIDTIQFECDFNSPDEARKILERALKSEIIEYEILEFAMHFVKKYGNHFIINKLEAAINSQQKFIKIRPSIPPDEFEEDNNISTSDDFSDLSTFERPLGQHFAIPNTVLFHVLRNANFTLLKILFGLCKSMFAKFRIILCHDLLIGLKIRGSSPGGSTLSLQLNEIRNFYVSNSLTVMVLNDRTFLQWLSRELYRCNAESLDFGSQDIPLNVLNFFIHSNKIGSISLIDCTIIHENGQLFTLQEVMALFPNASKIKMGAKFRFTPTTVQDIVNLELNEKIKQFTLHGVPDFFNPSLFYDFIEKNSAPSATFTLYLAPEVPEHVKFNIQNVFKAKIMTPFRNSESPKIIVF